MTRNENTYIDLFAGCGGLSLGMHNAGWKGLFAIEKSPDAFLTLKHNLIETKNHFNWPAWLPKTNLEIKSVLSKYRNELSKLRGKVSLIVGGPPCQGFSVAGRRVESDVRNGLIKSYLQFVKIVSPKIIFFENVKGFTLNFHKNKSKGIVYSNYVVEQLNNLGYDVSGQLIDFSNYGIPQKRTRFILIGIRKDICKRKKVNSSDFFELIIKNKNLFVHQKNIPENPDLQSAISDLLKSNGLTPTPDRKNFYSGVYSKPQSKYQEYLRNDSALQFPDSHSYPKHREKIISRFTQLLKKANGNKKINFVTRKEFNISKHTTIPLVANEAAPTITTLPDDYIHYIEPRILTVREYARIQSFPDWFEFKGRYTTGGKRRIKETPRYTQIGNAIPPLFGEQSGLVLKEILGDIY